MTLIDRARHLLTCDELRGRVPDEVAEFLREVMALEPVASTDASIVEYSNDAFEYPMYPPESFDPKSDVLLYTLETPHDAG